MCNEISKKFILPKTGIEVTAFSDGRFEYINSHGEPMCILGAVQSNGTLKLGVRKGNVRDDIAAHLIIANLFLPNPNGSTKVEWKDGNKCNNAVSNLRWKAKGKGTTNSILSRSCTEIPKNYKDIDRSKRETEMFIIEAHGEEYKFIKTLSYNPKLPIE
jgi:hypothetical protein